MPKDWSRGAWHDLLIDLELGPSSASIASQLPHAPVRAPAVRLPISQLDDLGKFAFVRGWWRRSTSGPS